MIALRALITVIHGGSNNYGRKIEGRDNEGLLHKHDPDQSAFFDSDTVKCTCYHGIK